MHRGIARDETAYYGKKNSAEIVDVKAEASPVILQTRTDEPVQIQPENHAYRTAAFGYENKGQYPPYLPAHYRAAVKG